MNFKKSTRILEEIKKAKKVLLAFHEGVDPDSIVSNLALKKFLLSCKKDVELVCNDRIPRQFVDLYDISGVKQEVDFTKFNFGEFDLFVTLDVNEPRRLHILEGTDIPIKTINIDHHASKNVFDGLKINDSSYSSTAEMVFYLLNDFKYQIDQETANLILIGILTDTESFNYNVSPRVFNTVSKLLELGANFDEANYTVYRNNSLDTLRFWALALNNMNVDEENGFAYTTVTYKEMSAFKGVIQAGRSVADKFVRTIKGTDFGIVMTERENGQLKISVRSRGVGFNVIPLLSALGGGGHITGGGAMIKESTFEKSVEKVLTAARKFANERKNRKV